MWRDALFIEDSHVRKGMAIKVYFDEGIGIARGSVKEIGM
jgi:hypothetical protein